MISLKIQKELLFLKGRLKLSGVGHELVAQEVMQKT